MVRARAARTEDDEKVRAKTAHTNDDTIMHDMVFSIRLCSALVHDAVRDRSAHLRCELLRPLRELVPVLFPFDPLVPRGALACLVVELGNDLRGVGPELR